MDARYPAIYRDARGEEATTIRNDGFTLRMMLRGVEFESQWLDDFEPTAVPLDDPALAAFTLHFYGQNKENAHLCGYALQFDMPLPVVMGTDNTTVTEATLRVSFELGSPEERREVILLTLYLEGKEYRSSGKSRGWFDDEMLDIQRSLPGGVYMKACINCAFGDYPVGGYPAFGGMRCFRGCKSQYLKVRTQREYLEIMNDYTELVQETYLCPEFQRRVRSTGFTP